MSEAHETIDQLKIENEELRAELNNLQERHDAFIDLIRSNNEDYRQRLDEITSQNEIVAALISGEMSASEFFKDYRNELLKDYRSLIVAALTPEINRLVNQYNQLREVVIKHKRAEIYFKTKLKKYQKGRNQLKQNKDATWGLIQEEYDKRIADNMKPSKALNEIGELIESLNEALISRGKKTICVKNDKKLKPNRSTLYRQLVRNRK